ncbi:AAA family ATPase, partial [Streptomyces sp. NPDC048845]|uniref:ATP-binding protein n=1 Tax=Streptomyces sp. NPDC048845 TaxID=3155390 RepID=UPI003447C38F
MTPALLGREHPAGLLRAAIARTAESHGGLVLVTGEAGIGKTALVTGAAEEARRQGALVLGGSCWDSESAPGHWPWVQVVRALRLGARPEEWSAAEAVAGRGLAVLLGEAPARPADTQAAGPAAVEEFQLFDAVTSALVSVSRSRPVVVVLDDLHWSDTASLRLLEFAAQHTWFERLLLIGTYRDVEVESPGHPLRGPMTPLTAKAATVTLTGLGPEETGALMARTAGRAPDPELVAAVHRRTGGNPFFVEQTARLWHSGNSVTAVAPGVRDALRRRLSLLSEPVARLLSTAAVLGGEFQRQVLAATAAAPVPQVDRLLDEAVAARLVTARGAGRFAFAHDLVRETLYESLGEGEAARLHAEVVRAVDRTPALADRVLPADLAHHAHLAGPELPPDRALTLLVAAARDAGGRLAVDEVIGHLRRAHALAGAAGEPRRRIVTALDLGEQLLHEGSRAEAWRYCRDAADQARELGDADLLARVALTLHRQTDLRDPDQERLKTELLAEAHRLTAPGSAADGADSAALARRDESFADVLVRELTVRSTALARRGGDDDALEFSLWARHNAIWGPGSAPERLTLIDELIDLARRTGDQDMEVFAKSFRWVALLEQGDPRCLDQFHALLRLAERSGTPRARFASTVDGAIVAAFRGGFPETETLLERTLAEFDHDHPQVRAMVDHVRWSALLHQGRFGELPALHRAMSESGHPHPGLPAAVTAVELGDLDSALRHHEEVMAAAAATGGEPYPREWAPLWLRCRAQTAALARDPELCEQARAAIAPYAGQWAVSLYGCDIQGPMALWSALLDAAQERWDDAVEGYGEALRSAARLDARPWSVDARIGLAGALLGRGGAGDAARARELLDEAVREAGELGMRHIPGRVRELWAAAGHGAAAGAPAGTAGGTAGGLCVRGRAGAGEPGRGEAGPEETGPGEADAGEAGRRSPEAAADGAPGAAARTPGEAGRDGPRAAAAGPERDGPRAAAAGPERDGPRAA